MRRYDHAFLGILNPETPGVRMNGTHICMMRIKQNLRDIINKIR